MQDYPPSLINPVTVRESTHTAAPVCADPESVVRGIQL